MTRTKIYINPTTHLSLTKLKEKLKFNTYNESVEYLLYRYSLQPEECLFVDDDAILPPVVKEIVSKHIPKKKPIFDIDEYNEVIERTRKHIDPLGMLKGIPLNTPLDKVRKTNPDYNEKTQAFIDEYEAGKPWLKKWKHNKK
jgi:hypothetical protein